MSPRPSVLLVPCLQGFFEVYAEADSMAELAAALQTLPPAKLAPYRLSSWKIVVDTWGAVYSLDTSRAMIDQLGFLPLMGRVQLVDPDVKFWLIVVDTRKGPGGLPPVRSQSTVPHLMWSPAQHAPHSSWLGARTAYGRQELCYPDTAVSGAALTHLV